MSGRRKQSYCDSYAETFTFIKKSTKGEHHAYCKSCNCDISISAGGANDIKRHMNNDKHKKNAEALQRASLHTQPLSSFCKKEDLSVIRAEVLFTDFLVEHSIQPAVADHTGGQAYKIHGTVGPPVPERNCPPQKIFKTEKKKKKKPISEKNENVNIS